MVFLIDKLRQGFTASVSRARGDREGPQRTLKGTSSPCTGVTFASSNPDMHCNQTHQNKCNHSEVFTIWKAGCEPVDERLRNISADCL